MSTAWNLMRLVSYPALKEAREDQVKTDEARRMALSMAILTQLRISLERYRLAMEDFKLADTAAPGRQTAGKLYPGFGHRQAG